MHSTRYTVLLLNVELREGVLWTLIPITARTSIDRCITNISLRRGIDDVTHLETLDGLILRASNKLLTTNLANAAEAMCAAHRLYMTSTHLGTSMVSKRT